MSERLRRAWQHRGALARLLWPLSQLYGALARLRCWLYAHRWLPSVRLPVPVIVIGNVVAGGSGKTPITIALAQYLRANGRHPGVISRGYGRTTDDCRPVLPASTASDVGDEPLLIARRTQVPVYVAQRRADAGRALLAAHPATDILLCDDGLQHLALARDLELCVFSDSGAGNGWLLPAGPLREPWPRAVDAVLYRGTPPAGASPAFAVQRSLADYAISASGDEVELRSLIGQPLHALAGIAEPETFFAMLRAQGLTLAHAEALPDHHHFDSWQRPADMRQPLICTEKDAVKLWHRYTDVLAVPLQTSLAPAFLDWLDTRLASLSSRHGPQTA